MDYSYGDFKKFFVNYYFFINYDLIIQKEKAWLAENEIKVRKGMLKAEHVTFT